MATIESIPTTYTADGTAVKAFYTTNWTSGKFVQYGYDVEFQVNNWSCGDYFTTLEEAQADYDRRVEGLPADWTCEHNCSNGRVHGGFAAIIEREVWELDEDGELYDLLESDTIDMAVWDGENWV